MAIASRNNIPAFLMAIMVGNGANAGALSPFAPTGVIATALMNRIGLAGHEWATWFNNALAHMIVAFAGYFALGGWRLFSARHRHGQELAAAAAAGGSSVPVPCDSEPFTIRHWITLSAIAGVIARVLLFRANVGMAAFTAAVVLAALGAAEHTEAIRRMPWNVILMVCGVTLLIAVVEKTNGIALFSGALARFATPATAVPAVAFVTGLLSVYSSTSGVILPAFLPAVPGLVARLGAVDPFALASAVNVGGHLVDVSPLSTIGALCLAAAPDHARADRLFRKLLLWGLSMTVIGPLLCWVLFG
jgi:di/tricarboxylate transporter